MGRECNGRSKWLPQRTIPAVRRPPPQSIPLLLALAPASALAYGSIGDGFQARAGHAPMDAGIPAALLGLAIVAGVGRLLLSFLPVGAPGSHQFGRLPFTWAASHLLGSLALGLQYQCWSARGLAAAWPWLILAIARQMSLPAPMLPRHDPPTQRAGACTKLSLWSLIWLAALAPGLSLLLGSEAPSASKSTSFVQLVSTPFGSTAPLAGSAHWLALCFFCLQGLELARRAVPWRLLLVAGLAGIPTAAMAASSSAGELSGALYVLAATSCAVGWFRRADRRLRALACVSLSALLPTSFVAALIALLALVLLSPKPSRRSTAIVAATCAIIVAIPSSLTVGIELGTLASWDGLRTQFDSLQNTWLWLDFAWLTPLVLFACLWCLLFQIGRKREPDQEHPRVDAPGRELSFALVALLLCLAGLANPSADIASGVESGATALRAAGNLPWLGVGMLLLGLSWLPAERLTIRTGLQAKSPLPKSPL